MIQPISFLTTGFPGTFDLTLELGPALLLGLLVLAVVASVLVLSAALAADRPAAESRTKSRTTVSSLARGSRMESTSKSMAA